MKTKQILTETNCPICGSALIGQEQLALICSAVFSGAKSHYYSDFRGENAAELFKEYIMNNIYVTVFSGKTFVFSGMAFENLYEPPSRTFERALTIDEIKRIDRMWVMK